MLFMFFLFLLLLQLVVAKAKVMTASTVGGYVSPAVKNTDAVFC